MECPIDAECDTTGEMCCTCTNGSSITVKLCTPVTMTQTPSEAPYPANLASTHRGLTI